MFVAPMRTLTRFARWLLLIVPVALSTQRVVAQSVVRESGARLAGGVFLPQADGLDAGAAAEAAVFYSHYFCGKTYGYHIEGGVNYSGLEVAGASGSLIRPFVGVYGKLRPHRYNRKTEIALLLGPRLDYTATTDPSDLNDEPLQVGLHSSLWLRLPRGRSHSWFVQLGATYYPTDLLQNASGGSLLVQGGVGTTFWHD